jgi:hypothetical protein
LPPTSHRIGNRLVIDKERDHAQVALLYRIDDANGFAVYPPTAANGTVLAVPERFGDTIYLSIAQKQDDDGHSVVCPPKRAA